MLLFKSEYMRLLRIMFVFISLAAYGQASGDALWGKTEYGMTVEQVKKVVPKAQRPKTPENLREDLPELLRINNVQIVNNTFVAHFYFRDGKLFQVSLTLRDPGKFVDAMRVFDSLTEVLRAKYGKEITMKVINEDDVGSFDSADATWVSGRTNIDLYLLSINDGDALLKINYQVRIAEEADKL